MPEPSDSPDARARDLSDRRRPAFLERYAISEVIAKGSTAVVYGAVDQLSHGDVAIKLPRDDVHISGTKRQAFQLEAALTARLNHPSIVRVLDHGMSEGQTPYMVMERLRGSTLDTHLALGLPGELQALLWTRQIADALGAAHDGGIVHCDLKPQNVVLVEIGGREFVKLIDFGIARWAEDDDADAVDMPGPVRSMLAAGHPEYMSPEMNRSQQVAVQSDVYSLGCLLFAMIEGEPPFPSEGDPRAAILGHRDEALPWATKCSRLTASLIRQMLRKDPTQRIDSCGTLLRRIDACVEIVRNAPPPSEAAEGADESDEADEADFEWPD